MKQQSSTGRPLTQYLTGFVLALVLTAIPFAIVATGAASRAQSLAVVAVAAVVQVLVHLRYFLHMNFSTTPRENILAFAFAAILILIMLGGSFWIMFNLHSRMR